MGFKNKKPVFTPLDLNEENVHTIFNRCLATDKTKNTQHITLFLNALGFSENSKPIIFDKEKLESNQQQIMYLYGQLNDTHQNVIRITPNSASIKYNSEKWTNNSSIMMEFLHLGCATLAILPFRAETMAAGLKCELSTLSPKDPHFSDWWEQHKSEWETANK